MSAARTDRAGSPPPGPHAVLWSGGKDSCLALWRARRAGYSVNALVNFFDEASGRVRFHAVRANLIGAQAAAMDLELFQHATLPDTYATCFAEALGNLKTAGYVGLIAGDIHLTDVRGVNQEAAFAAGLHLVEPLWHLNGVMMLREFLDAGFEAVLTCCKEGLHDVLQPGRRIDAAFVSAVAAADIIDVSGENGEYHSFVFDGPLFAHAIRWKPGEIRRTNGFAQLDLIPI
jgi:diphthine-ammonia ligase